MDKNGKEMKKGSIAHVEGGYFQADNGFFRIENAPGDPDWLGSDWCLCRINKNGTESAGKHKTAFWPLMVTVSGREKRIEAWEHNKKYATIEIIQ